MELQFVDKQQVYTGDNPAMVHMPDNSIWGFQIIDGRLQGSNITPEPGDVDWPGLEFADFAIVTADQNMSLMRLKNVPRMGIYGVWHQDEVLNEELEVVTPERHRFAIWDAINDVSIYLEELRFEMNKGNPVTQIVIRLKNPSFLLSAERTSRFVPGMKIELFFTSGDSEEYPCGVFYIDRVEMGTDSDEITIEGRNISGKFLKDQTWDEGTLYPIDVYAYNLIAMLVYAGIEDYDVQTPSNPLTAWEAGIEFLPQQTIEEGIKEYISMSLNWEIVEDLDGKIIAGSRVSYAPIRDRYSKYQFARGSEVFSRKVVRSDQDTYSKICYHSEQVEIVIVDGEEVEAKSTLRFFKEISNDKDWSYVPNKTLYVEAPQNTSLAELEELADGLESRLSKAGIEELFVGPFRPHIIPGDEAEITDEEGPSLIGEITTVGHVAGRNQGFFTYFMVDSGGLKNKPSIKNLIGRTSKPTEVARRMY